MVRHVFLFKFVTTNKRARSSKWKLPWKLCPKRGINYSHMVWSFGDTTMNHGFTVGEFSGSEGEDGTTHSNHNRAWRGNQKPRLLLVSNFLYYNFSLWVFHKVYWKIIIVFVKYLGFSVGLILFLKVSKAISWLTITCQESVKFWKMGS